MWKNGGGRSERGRVGERNTGHVASTSVHRPALQMAVETLEAADIERLADLKVSAAATADDDDDDDDDEPEEDSRISTLYAASDKLTPAEFVAKLDALGTADAIVLGNMCTDAETARAHFFTQALLDADEDTTLAQCVEEKRAALRAAAAGGSAARHAAFLANLESFVVHLDEDVRAANMEAFHESLKLCWEYEIVDEDALRAWVADERAARLLSVRTADARTLREGPGQAFLEWLEEGES